jgi:hypothetical protein
MPPAASDRPHIRRGSVPDLIFPSDNDLGIPTLLPDLQGSADDGPFVRWGSISRRSINRAAWHIYVDDYKFQGLWANAQQVVNTQCRCTVEANFSTAPGQPRAVALWSIFRKRWLARFWQSQGVRIIVDLNVDEEFQVVNLLGVPAGWRSYATRSHKGHGIETIEREHAAAVERAGTDQITFMVFGGGLAVREACASRGWIWTPEDADTKRGKFTNGKRQGDQDGQNRADDPEQSGNSQSHDEQPDQSQSEAGGGQVQVTESRQALIG